MRARLVELREEARLDREGALELPAVGQRDPRRCVAPLARPGAAPSLSASRDRSRPPRTPTGRAAAAASARGRRRGRRAPRPRSDGQPARDRPRLLAVELLPRAEDLEVQGGDRLEPVHDPRVEPERERVLGEPARLVDGEPERRGGGDDERERDRELEAGDAQAGEGPPQRARGGAAHRGPTSPARERPRAEQVDVRAGVRLAQEEARHRAEHAREPPPGRDPAAGFAMNSRVRWSCSFETGFTSTRASRTNGPWGKSETGPRSSSCSSASSVCSARKSRRTRRHPLRRPRVLERHEVRLFPDVEQDLDHAPEHERGAAAVRRQHRDVDRDDVREAVAELALDRGRERGAEVATLASRRALRAPRRRTGERPGRRGAAPRRGRGERERRERGEERGAGGAHRTLSSR